MKQTSMILMSDYYKQAHAEQYPEGITKLISYATARMTRIPKEMMGDKLTVFGIQSYVKDFLIDRFNGTFFNVPLEKAMEEYKMIIGETFPLQYVDTGKFEALHKLGYLPVEIGCLEEGTRVPIRNAFELPEGQCQVPFMYIINTHPEFPWITEFLESVTSSEVWYPMEIANQAFYYRQIVNKWYDKTGVIPEARKSAISEFGFRGGKSSDAAIKASSAFLTSFNKTATIPAIKYIHDYYGDPVKEIGGGMISTEHSVMCSNYAVDSDKIRFEEKFHSSLEVSDDRFKPELKAEDAEEVFLKRLFSELYPDGNISVVMDTYDYWANLQRCGVDINNVFESLEEVYNYINSKMKCSVDYTDKDDVFTVNCNVRNKNKIINIKMSYISAGSYGTNDLSAYIKDGYNKHDNLEFMLNNYMNGENCYCFINNCTIVIINFNNYAHFELYDIIMNRKGTVFFRGDSGDPVDIICGEKPDKFKDFTEVNEQIGKGRFPSLVEVDKGIFRRVDTEPGDFTWKEVDKTSVEILGTVELLAKMFGYTLNEKGYKVLDSHVRAIYGDSITPKRAEEIYRRLEEKGFAACNVALGAGSFSTQCAETDDGKLLPFTRDSYGIAIKCCYVEDKDGNTYEVFKNPKTDTGKFKKSQRGMIWVGLDKDGEIIAKDGYTSYNIPDDNMLVPIFRNGKMLKETTLKEVRQRLHNNNF